MSTRQRPPPVHLTPVLRPPPGCRASSVHLVPPPPLPSGGGGVVDGSVDAATPRLIHEFQFQFQRAPVAPLGRASRNTRRGGIGAIG